MPDRALPSCRGAGCQQGKHPEACDCGHPTVPLKEWPCVDSAPAWAVAVALVTLAIAVSSIFPMGLAR